MFCICLHLSWANGSVRCFRENNVELIFTTDASVTAKGFKIVFNALRLTPNGNVYDNIFIRLIKIKYTQIKDKHVNILLSLLFFYQFRSVG